MNVPLFAAGCLAILATAVHGLGGELLVVRKLSAGTLPSSQFGGPRTTRAMIHVTWHLASIAFLVVGCALILSASVLHGGAARAIGVLGAGAFTAFALVAIGVGGAYSPRSLLAHPGPTVFAAIAALAWWGAV